MQSSRQYSAASSLVLTQERDLLQRASPDSIARAHEECANDEVPDYSSVDVERRDKRLRALTGCFPLDSPIWRIHGAVFKIPERLSSQILGTESHRDPSVPILKLPPDVFLDITGYLNNHDRLCLALSCKYLLAVDHCIRHEKNTLSTCTPYREFLVDFICRIRPRNAQGLPDIQKWRACLVCRRLRPRAESYWTEGGLNLVRDPGCRHHPTREAIDQAWGPSTVDLWARGIQRTCPQCALTTCPRCVAELR